MGWRGGRECLAFLKTGKALWLKKNFFQQNKPDVGNL